MPCAALLIAIAMITICGVAAFIYVGSQPRSVEIVAMAVDVPQIALGLKAGSVVEVSLKNGALHENRRIAHCSGDWSNALFYTSRHELVCSGEKLRIVNRAGGQREIVVPKSESGGAFGSVAEFQESLAVIAASERILLIDASGKMRAQIGEHTALYGDVRASRDGAYLAAGGHAPQVWNADLRERRELARSNYTFGPIAFSATRLYIGNQDGCVYAWSVGDWTEWPRFCNNLGAVSQLAVSPDGKVLAIAGRSVVLLSTETAVVLGRIPRDAHSGLGFIDNTRLVLSMGSRVELWQCTAEACAPKAEMNIAR